MYSSRGGGNYGQQSSYASQTGYGQNLGTVYPGNSVGGPDSQQHSMASRHSSMLGASQEADTAAYRSHSSSTTHYGGQYGSVYSSAALSSKPQGPTLSAKGSGVPSALESRGGYASAISDSPKYLSSDYISSSNHGYGHRTDPLFTEKDTEYPTLDRRQYNERQSAYLGRDLKTDAAGRFSESVGFGHQRHADSYDRVDQMSLLRQEQLLKAQSQQSDALDGSSRQNDYLAAKAAASRHSTQELLSYGVRVDADPRNVSVLNSSYSGQHSASILGAAPRRNVDDLIYFQSSSNPGYGVSLPPGRDYAAGKGLHGTSLESEYSGSLLTHSSHPRIDEHQDDRAGYLREFELREEERRRDRLHMREKEREREKVREREHERDRERERRERERDRERERERERERILERQKERDREFKRGLEIRRERTPPRVSKDRRGTSLTKERRSLRRDSPHYEALHRRHSPVKEKRRDYVCKVYPHRLVDLERDYLSLEKRYPRLFISPEFVKVIVNWPKERLNLSIHTPVSFEHDFIDEEIVSGSKEISDEFKAREPEKSEHVNIVWNVKIILMSGISKNALEELSSERSSEDRIPHFCNILRFAILKRDRSFMAIGGPWQSSDGGDPSVDDNALVQTALRYAKDVAQLDLQNCHNWNRFLEIHYDRYGKDGVFSHKEVSVLFVPDLSDCLPSLNVWKEQWLAHKKTVAERERHIALKKEISKETKEGMEVKEMEPKKDSKSVDKSEKKEKIGKDVKEKSDKDDKGNTSEGRGNGSSTKIGSKDGDEKGKEALIVEKLDQEVAGGTQKSGTVSSAKKKVVKKIVKQKAKAVSDASSKKNDKVGEKVDGEKNSDIPLEPPSNDSAGAKTLARKKVIKRVGKSAQNEKNKDILSKGENEMDCSEDKSKDNSELNATATQGTVVKTTVKKKVIKRVPKKKVTVVVSSVEASKKRDVDGHDKKATPDETLNVEKPTTDDKQEKKISKSKTSPTSLKQSDSVNLKKAEKEHMKNENETGKDISPVTSSVDKLKVGEKDSSGGKREKSRDGEQSKDEKEKIVKDGSKSSKPNKEIKEKRKSEESPRHPGLILQTKGCKDSKFRSLSLSLDSLLEYTDKDIEEPTFELSLFAESLYEMLQFQMGSRILTFLQKLRVKFVTKRNQRKRQREVIQKEDNKKSSPKRPKTVDISIENQSIEPKISSLPPKDAVTPAPAVEGNDLDGHVDETKMETETEYSEEPEEDPEEDPEEYEELDDTSSPHNSSNENEANEEDATMGGDEEDATMGGDEEDATMGGDEGDATMGGDVEDAKTELNEEAKTAANEEPANVAANEPDGTKGSNQESLSKKKTESDKKGRAEEETKKEVSSPKEAVVDKELLQAFRFFDRNLVGYIRVEEMRMVIHNMGKFLSHRDVKELVHSALLESNTGRDDRILYGKLVRMSDL